MGKTADGKDVRFTVKPDALYIHVFTDDLPEKLQIQNLQIPENALVQMLGDGSYLPWQQNGAGLTISVPTVAKAEPVTVFKVILA